jgi:peptidoglycan-N-acetylglucosamine deacetylase
VGLGQILKNSVALCWPSRVVVRGSRRSRHVALTFDDGPHPEQTPLLLKELERADVKATFFLQGNEAAKWPDLVRRTHAAGHQIANHGHLHQRASERPASEVVADIEYAHALLEGIVGEPLRRDVRPPYGDITLPAFLGLVRRGFRMVFWSLDSGDSWHRTPQELLSHLNSMKCSGGENLLFHEDYAHTVAAIPEVIAILRAQGLGFCRIDQM